MHASRRGFLQAGGVLVGTIVGGLLVRAGKARTPSLLRPPGADAQKTFLARCIRCSQCIQACPSDVLRIAGAETGLGMGTPYLVARDRPCDLCLGRDEMRCIPACPTDALSSLARREDVRMGTAVVDPETCYPYVGVSCRACWHACPFPDDAISFDSLGHPLVHAGRCVGCGLCEHACLTPKPSIHIVPSP